MWPFGGTEAEKKRDDYYELWNNLKLALKKHDAAMSLINEAYNSYKGSIPFLSPVKIPSDDFEPKRAEKTREMEKYVDYEDLKTIDLTKAKDIAYEKYLHYKKIAEEEARERKEAFLNLFGGGK